MFLTERDTGIVTYVGTVAKSVTAFNVEVYKTPIYSYPVANHVLYDEDADVVAGKNTYIDGVIGINPDWAEPEEPTTPELSQMDRIEKMLNALTSETVTTESISAAISEGVNEV